MKRRKVYLWCDSEVSYRPKQVLCRVTKIVERGPGRFGIECGNVRMGVLEVSAGYVATPHYRLVMGDVRIAHSMWTCTVERAYVCMNDKKPSNIEMTDAQYLEHAAHRWRY